MRHNSANCEVTYEMVANLAGLAVKKFGNRRPSRKCLHRNLGAAKVESVVKRCVATSEELKFIGTRVTDRQHGVAISCGADRDGSRATCRQKGSGGAS